MQREVSDGCQQGNAMAWSTLGEVVLCNSVEKGLEAGPREEKNWR